MAAQQQQAELDAQEQADEAASLQAIFGEECVQVQPDARSLTVRRGGFWPVACACVAAAHVARGRPSAAGQGASAAAVNARKLHPPPPPQVRLTGGHRRSASGADAEQAVVVRVLLPADYPSASPPLVELHAPLSAQQHAQAVQHMEGLFTPGGCNQPQRREPADTQPGLELLLLLPPPPPRCARSCGQAVSCLLTAPAAAAAASRPGVPV
jgi:hypothetical protein